MQSHSRREKARGTETRSPYGLWRGIDALEKRTCGEFLDAGPSLQRRILRNAGTKVSKFRRSSFKVVETLKRCHLETWPIYLRRPSFVMTVL